MGAAAQRAGRHNDHATEYAQDGDHHQQFEKGEPGLAGSSCAHHLGLIDTPVPLVDNRVGRAASAHTVDVRDGAGMRALADDVVATHGGCHVLVNNAGVTSAGSFEAESDDDLHWIVDINVSGMVGRVTNRLVAPPSE